MPRAGKSRRRAQNFHRFVRLRAGTKHDRRGHWHRTAPSNTAPMHNRVAVVRAGLPRAIGLSMTSTRPRRDPVPPRGNPSTPAAFSAPSTPICCVEKNVGAWFCWCRVFPNAGGRYRHPARLQKTLQRSDWGNHAVFGKSTLELNWTTIVTRHIGHASNAEKRFTPVTHVSLGILSNLTRAVFV